VTQVQFEKVIEEVKALSPAEQRQFRTLLAMFLVFADAALKTAAAAGGLQIDNPNAHL
jgi:hypothetical protein